MISRGIGKSAARSVVRSLSQFGSGGVAPPALLLDTYPGAAAAYSLRKLSSSYSGSAIRVRRASDSAEQDIAFSGNDLDTASLTSFCTGTDGFVTTWYDQSGNTRDATQATTTAQPKIYDSTGGAILENSKPAIEFDGSNDGFLTTNTDLSYTTSISAVWMTTDISQLPTIWMSDSFRRLNVGVYYGFYLEVVNADLHSGYGDGTGTTGDDRKTLVTSGISNNTQFLTTSIFKGISDTESFTQGVSNSPAYSGTSTLSVANSASAGSIGYPIGLSTWFIGKMQEIIVHEIDQSSNRTGIESNIATYYGITLS